METLKKKILNIEIINPEVEKLLESLANLNFIKIKDNGIGELRNILTKIRNNSDEEISLDEITKEVEIVRKARYEKEKNNN